MIEENIVNILNLGDSIPIIDSYANKRWLKVYHLLFLLHSNYDISFLFIYICFFFYFSEIIILSTYLSTDRGDKFIIFLKSINKIFLLEQLVTTKTVYLIAITLYLLLIVIIIILIVIIGYSKGYGLLFRSCIKYLKIINCLLLYYLIGPIVFLAFSCFHCANDNRHVYLGINCYVDYKHIILIAMSSFILAFYVLYTIFISIYGNKIGSIQGKKLFQRVNCNYELYISMYRMVLSTFAFSLQSQILSWKLIWIFQLVIFIYAIFFTYYFHQVVMYYDNRINVININGWLFISWVSFLALMREMLNINDITLFIIIGWIIMFVLSYLNAKIKLERILTEGNIFEEKSLKNIEIFTSYMIETMTTKDLVSIAKLNGIIKKYENYFSDSTAMFDKYHMLLSKDYFKKRYFTDEPSKVISIIAMLYEHLLIKSNIKSDIMLIYGYFLITYLNNNIYAICLSSKFKVTKLKSYYLKYILMEEIKQKEFLILNKKNNKDSLKHCPLSNVIMYNYLIDELKIKIFDSACFHLDYFELMKNKSTLPHITSTLLKTSQDIYHIRKTIIDLWNQIVNINQFCNDIFKDYMLYLNIILEDNEQIEQVRKDYNNNKLFKNESEDDLYHSMFNKESASVLLINGNSSEKGKILYATQNFFDLYGYYLRDVLNMSLDDLLPHSVKPFHNELIYNSIYYSHSYRCFLKEKDIFIRVKSGMIINVSLFVKALPNISYGLIFIVHLKKISDDSMMLLLNKEFLITDIGDFTTKSTDDHLNLNSYFNLRENICGDHVAIFLPEILLQMEYNTQAITLINGDIDLKGTLYQIHHLKDIQTKVNNLLDRIKQSSRIQFEDGNIDDITIEYDNLIREMSMQELSTLSVFYRITPRSFNNGKYMYYRVYIYQDMLYVGEKNYNLLNNTILPDLNSKRKMSSLMKTKPNPSIKQIKIKLCDDNNNLQPNENKELLEDIIRNPIQNQLKEIEATDNSIKSSQSLPSYSTFIKIKQCIIQKKEINHFIHIKVITIAFLLLTIIIAFCLYQFRHTTFNNVTSYLDQNQFFDSTKILTGSIYLLVTNLIFITNAIIKPDLCEIPCNMLYDDLFKKNINELKEINDRTIYFMDEFKLILNMTMNVTITMEINSKEVVFLSYENAVKLIISTSFEFIDYFNNSDDSSLYLIGANLLNLLWGYFSNSKYIGVVPEVKEKELNTRRYEIDFFPFIANVLVLDLLFGLICWKIYSIKTIELFFIEKMINFRNNDFDLYLKRLEEFKKRLKNETGEDEGFDNNNKSSEMNSISEGNNTNNNSVMNSNKNNKTTNKRKENENKNATKRNQTNKKMSKSAQRNKITKAQLVKNAKIHKLSSDFTKSNIVFLVKIGLSLFITLIYYVIFTVFHKNYKKDYLLIDEIMISIEEVYKSSYITFLMMKRQTNSYITFESEKAKGIKAFEAGALNYTIGKITYKTKEQLQNSYYNILIPSNMVILPQMGNKILPLIKNSYSRQGTTEKLNELYNGDCCKIIFGTDQQLYDNCSTFWSGIITKGLEQAMVQMGVVFNSALGELYDVNNKLKPISFLFTKESSFWSLEYFLDLYLMYAYRLTHIFFEELRKEKYKSISDVFIVFFSGFVLWLIIVFAIIQMLIVFEQRVVMTFFNFIIIFPYQYLVNDEKLCKEIINLEKQFY